MVQNAAATHITPMLCERCYTKPTLLLLLLLMSRCVWWNTLTLSQRKHNAKRVRALSLTVSKDRVQWCVMICYSCTAVLLYSSSYSFHISLSVCCLFYFLKSALSLWHNYDYRNNHYHHYYYYNRIDTFLISLEGNVFFPHMWRDGRVIDRHT